MGLNLSILHWRCTPEEKFAFLRTLLQIFQYSIGDAQWGLDATLRLAVRLSILHWRCFEMPSARKRVGLGFNFQYSIGDAEGEVHKLGNFTVVTFQYSIGDAGSKVTVAYNNLPYRLSILHWRCLRHM